MSAEWAGQYGRMVVIDHGNGVQTYYAHMSRLEAIAGQWVHCGEIIGRSGSSGRATGAHVHYEVRRRGTPVNPSHFLHATYAAASPSANTASNRSLSPSPSGLSAVQAQSYNRIANDLSISGALHAPKSYAANRRN